MQTLISVLFWLRARAENLVALLLATMFVTFLIQIVFRYILGLPLGWTVEYVAIAWLWGILFGYAFVVKDVEIIRLDLIYFAVPPKVRRVMDVISNIIVALILAWSLPKAYDYVTFMKIERTAFMRIPFDLVFSIYIPFVATVILRCSMTVWRAFTNRGYDTQSAASPEQNADV